MEGCHVRGRDHSLEKRIESPTRVSLDSNFATLHCCLMKALIVGLLVE